MQMQKQMPSAIRSAHGALRSVLEEIMAGLAGAAPT